MFTNQKILGLILVLFVVGTSIYFTFDKFRKDISVSASPSPTPDSLDFSALNKANTQNQPQPTELPLAKNKKLPQFPGILTNDLLQNKKAVIVTEKGTISIQIFADVPMTASNFMILAANGFYDGLIFHRVERGFVIQGGDPLGNGSGGPGYQFQDEPVTKEYIKGVVAMANAGPNTNGSQFFIMLEDHPELPKSYTIFGTVISGMEVVEKITVGDVMQKVVIQNLQ